MTTNSRALQAGRDSILHLFILRSASGLKVRNDHPAPPASLIPLVCHIPTYPGGATTAARPRVHYRLHCMLRLDPAEYRSSAGGTASAGLPRRKHFRIRTSAWEALHLGAEMNRYPPGWATRRGAFKHLESAGCADDKLPR